MCWPFAQDFDDCGKVLKCITEGLVAFNFYPALFALQCGVDWSHQPFTCGDANTSMAQPPAELFEHFSGHHLFARHLMEFTGKLFNFVLW
jgi:hypothetical protein